MDRDFHSSAVAASVTLLSRAVAAARESEVDRILVPGQDEFNG